MKKHPNYNHERPYNDRIIKIHKEHKIDTFTKNAEFWTLGGPEHHEYTRLSTKLTFGPRSYCTVDRGRMDETNKKEISTYSYSEFMDIPELWHNPLAISYDSTELLTSGIRNRETEDISHDKKIIDLARLTLAALRTTTHKKIAVHANYMVSYPATRKQRDLSFSNDYIRWTELFLEWMTGYKVKTYDGVSEKMEGSRTEMVDFHFVISKK